MRGTRTVLLAVALGAAFLLDAAPGRADDEVGLPAPITDSQFYEQGTFDPAKVELGRLLFFDKILSGNRNISCATCHHPLAATGDGLSLPVGEGGRGLAGARDTGRGRHAIVERVPRNAPALFNLGARQFRTMFHDGRVQKKGGEPSGFRSPAGADLPMGLDNVLAAQAMFPVTSATEMAGQTGENEIADAAAAGNLPLVWERLETRLRSIPVYVELFTDAFDEVSDAGDLRFVHAANAIAAFEAAAWRADNSPFDRYLRGETRAMSPAARRGMELFYGELGCASCHSGVFQTDHRFHAIAMPQIGPGKGDGVDGHEDHGRARVTGRRGHLLKFRTAPLRNVAITGPWGHAGAYDTLRAVVEHHFDPAGSLERYDPAQAMLPPRADLDRLDFVVHSNPGRRDRIARRSELRARPVKGLASKIDDLIEFLHALTDPASLDLREDIPEAVPSGLPIAD
ncbi:MAG: cytochrome c peroxidase [Thermoanaerobaculia bacterium]|nr:cytochrome c peroxidase [Thermoanaerobaculia bacterium]